MTASAPPNEWPTSRYGLCSPAVRNSSWRLFARVEKVCGPDGGSLVPAPKWAYEHTRADFATSGSMAPQFSPPSPSPAISTTVVSPAPEQ